MDANFTDVNGTNRQYSSMKKHNLVFDDDFLTIDNRRFPITANDRVAVYIREEGTYKSNYELS